LLEGCYAIATDRQNIKFFQQVGLHQNSQAGGFRNPPPMRGA
jgi:hypothetical protein